MKLIIAIIRPDALDSVQRALQTVLDEADKYRLTVAPVQGHGRQEGEVEFFRGQAVRKQLVTRLQVTIGVNDQYVDRAIDAIISGARSGENGEVGDGKIFVVPLERCIRIRTGESGGGAV